MFQKILCTCTFRMNITWKLKIFNSLCVHNSLKMNRNYFLKAEDKYFSKLVESRLNLVFLISILHNQRGILFQR